ncbi:translation initiation factor 2 [Breoghania sp. JC706]|uniref:translation initiation factor 2 n=1 Tax=Breoghania sp. JC706 TaxID=3117732 RepID=UPI00300B95B9
MIRIFACLLLAGGLAACGTVTRGTEEQVSFHSNPDGAKAQTTLGLACTTPCTLDIPRKKTFQVTMTKEGYEAQTVDVKTEVSGGGAAGVAGNVLLGGVIGVGVDMATGAALNHAPNPVFVDFEAPENTSKPPKQPEVKPYEPKGPQPIQTPVS